jgi:hypothetical protein
MPLETKRNGVRIIKSGQCSKRKDKLTEKEAILRAELMSAEEGWRWNHYPCPKCGTFHVGHEFPRERTTRS